MLASGRNTTLRNDSTALDLAALRSHLDSHLSTPTIGPLEASLISGGRSNLTYHVSDRDRSWVLRRPPHGEVLATAHDMSREFRVMSALAGTKVPVPRTVALSASDEVIGAPFYVMDEVDGTIYRARSQVEALTEKERSQLGYALVDTLAELHTIDVESVGLQDLGRPSGYLARQVARWTRQYEASKVRELADVARIATRLEAAIPVSSDAGIVHGDYRIDNVMFARDDPSRVVAVLDWEMATLGDPLADLGILVSFWDEAGRPYNPITAGLTAFPGFPSATEVVAQYAWRRNLDVEDLDWYIVFGYFKLAVILEQIHARHLRGETLGESFETIGEMVVPLLERALDTASHSRHPSLRG